MTFDYDLFTIGAGSGGVRASRLAAAHGAKVAIAEEYRVGGTCVIRGCVPKKLLVYASRFAKDFQDAKGFGWTPGKAEFDWKTLIANKDKEIDRLNAAYMNTLGKAGVEIIQSRAELKDEHTIHLVNENRDVTAKRILITTGAHPNPHQDLCGHDLAITSNEAFQLEDLPKRIAIVGAGYIAVEFANIFHGLGVDTTIIYRGAQIMSGFDDDLRLHLQESMAKRGVKFLLQRMIRKLDKTTDGIQATISQDERIDVDQIMLAIGRVPNTAGLGLERAGVTLERTGAIAVDQYSTTNVPHIYALGDVTNRMQLTPVAIMEAMAFVETVFKDNPTKPDYRMVPTAVFSNPEIGTVGYTQAQAELKFGDVDVFKSTYKPMKYTLAGRDERALMKLIVERRTNRVLGCHIIGPDAGEMIQCVAIAVKMGATKRDFDATVAVHPSAAEELVTMR